MAVNYKELLKITKSFLQISGEYQDQINQAEKLKEELYSSFKEEIEKDQEDIIVVVNAIERKIRECQQMILLEEQGE